MIAQELIGCRVIKKDCDDNIVTIGKIIGGGIGGEKGYGFFMVMNDKGKVSSQDVDYIEIHPDDFNKLYPKLQPIPIGSRSEILDIRTEE